MGEKFSATGAEIARDANAHILEMYARFHEITVHSWRDEDTIQMFCECGCMGLLDSTPTDYSHHGGAWIEGHKRSD